MKLKVKARVQVEVKVGEEVKVDVKVDAKVEVKVVVKAKVKVKADAWALMNVEVGVKQEGDSNLGGREPTAMSCKEPGDKGIGGCHLLCSNQAAWHHKGHCTAGGRPLPA